MTLTVFHFEKNQQHVSVNVLVAENCIPLLTARGVQRKLGHIHALKHSLALHRSLCSLQAAILTAPADYYSNMPLLLFLCVQEPSLLAGEHEICPPAFPQSDIMNLICHLTTLRTLLKLALKLSVSSHFAIIVFDVFHNNVF